MLVGVTECDYCGNGYDPVATRWRCPACGFKGHCCEGAACVPQPGAGTGLEDLSGQAAPSITR